MSRKLEPERTADRQILGQRSAGALTPDAPGQGRAIARNV